ncbi:MAG: phosphoribosylglycinamide formyltransferase [Saprospiraceae bacterium]|jgi:phosphoribosylglycinamide formyltransferase-1|nr:phosphoribosylglycinamide formyltransferase [Saprospiraceae bacterium]
MSKSLKNIAILASGAGSNAQKILEHFSDRMDIAVRLIVSNKQEAGVLNIAKVASIDTFVVTRDSFYSSTDLLVELNKRNIDFIVLAGFLWLIPPYLIQHYPDRIINIHPALLPKYGGKGMYGHFVHEAVHLAKDNHSGITIHYVNEKYDEGSIVFQERCEILPSDQPEDIAKKVQVLEHLYYPTVIDQLVSSLPL